MQVKYHVNHMAILIPRYYAKHVNIDISFRYVFGDAVVGLIDSYAMTGERPN